MGKKYTIKFDRNKCVGAASCIEIAPDTWGELDEDGKAVLKKKQIDEKDLAKNIQAAKSCPTHAIEIFDETGKKIV